MAKTITKVYKANPTPWKFHQSNKFVRGIMGPIGSGKSVACCAEIYRRAMEQGPGTDGVARSRWAVVRNTYRELLDTTIKTWLAWFPDYDSKTGAEVFGPINKSTMTHTLEVRNDKGEMTHHIEVMFRALDTPADVAKLLSLELTGAWINEARELPIAIKQNLAGRLKRYPVMEDRNNVHFCLIMDTNPPDSDHWWYKLAEEDTPNNHEFFRQPSALSKDAENLDNLEPDYYEDLMQGAESDWVKVYVKGEYGYVQDGKPVYPDFSESFHVVDDIEPDKRRPIVIGMDFGLVPAAVFVQEDYMGNWVVYEELVLDNISTTDFAERVIKTMGYKFPGFDYDAYGDPSGDNRAANDSKARSAFQILAAAGLQCNPSPDRTNNINIRLEAVKSCLSSLNHGTPRLRVHRRCTSLIKGMAGRYRYRRINVGGGEKYHDKPDKDQYSHVNDALQYALLGGGENVRVTRNKRGRDIVVTGGVRSGYGKSTHVKGSRR